MQNTNPKFSDFQKGYDAGSADIAGMGWEASRNKFNADFIPGHNIADAGQRAWALGYFEALMNKAA
jgi:hypothetical protein